MSSKCQSRDWEAVYQEYCASGLSVEQFGKGSASRIFGITSMVWH